MVAEPEVRGSTPAPETIQQPALIEPSDTPVPAKDHLSVKPAGQQVTSPPTQVDSTKSRDRKDQKPQKRQRQKPVPQGRREQKSEEDKTFIIGSSNS